MQYLGHDGMFQDLGLVHNMKSARGFDSLLLKGDEHGSRALVVSVELEIQPLQKKSEPMSVVVKKIAYQMDEIEISDGIVIMGFEGGLDMAIAPAAIASFPLIADEARKGGALLLKTSDVYSARLKVGGGDLNPVGLQALGLFVCF